MGVIYLVFEPSRMLNLNVRILHSIGATTTESYTSVEEVCRPEEALPHVARIFRATRAPKSLLMEAKLEA